MDRAPRSRKWPWPIAAYVVAMALITLVSVYLAAETLTGDIAGEPPQEGHAHLPSRG